MTTSIRASAMCLLLLGGPSVSCRNPEWPAPEPGPANYMAGPGSAEALVAGFSNASDVQVRIEDFKFEPARITISPGTKVTWVNKDDEPHSATSSEKPKRFDSGVLDSDKSYSFTFTEQGSFSYFCKLHPHMTGVVEVR
ncbi:MAG TPA: cupredoxin family copper-binding protein [Planctomycetota bacterium]|nr:cupredoxin family copper-binding protein [Planctomycetota bacterium]